jgi:probable F420-dependent oxidoreductase
MKFGLWTVNIGEWGLPDNSRTLAKTAESFGFDSLWTSEHVVVPRGYTSDYPVPGGGRMPFPDDYTFNDPLVWLAWIAAQTTRIRLCTGIVVLPLRNAVLVAKELATLDLLSNGRVTLGIGLGWMREEFEALNVSFDERAALADDAVPALRALWSGTHATYHGRYWSFTDTCCSPQPLQEGGPPIVVSGNTRAAAKRAGALGDGWFPMLLDPPTLAQRLDDMRNAAQEASRDPERIEVTLGLFPDDPFAEAFREELARYEELGVSRIITPPMSSEPARFPELAERFATDVMGQRARPAGDLARK